MRIPTILAAIALTTLLAACDEDGEDEGEENATEQSVEGEEEEDQSDHDEFPLCSHRFVPHSFSSVKHRSDMVPRG